MLSWQAKCPVMTWEETTCYVNLTTEKINQAAAKAVEDNNQAEVDDIFEELDIPE